MGRLIAIKDFEMPDTCGGCPCCIHTADEKRYVGYCNTSDDDYFCRALDRFMEYDKVDGGVDILGKPSDCPLVEAIPIAEVKKFLEEGTKNVSNDVLAIVREDYIHKADYETRLKADLKAILVELQLKFEENTVRWYVGRVDGKSDDVVLMETINDIIQQKIDKLKGEEDGTNEKTSN